MTFSSANHVAKSMNSSHKETPFKKIMQANTRNLTRKIPTSNHGQKAYEPSRQRLSHTKKRRPITFTVNAHEKKAQEALF